MIIVSGYLIVDSDARSDFLAGCVEVARLARAAPGCIDFHLSADPIDDGRINVFEQWDSAEAVEAFRGNGPSQQQQTAIRDARVYQHEVASTVQL